MNSYEEFEDRLKFALDNIDGGRYLKWKPQNISRGEWDTVFDIIEENDGCDLFFLDPNSDRLYFVMPQEIDNQQTREEMFKNSSCLLMWSDLHLGVTESALMDMWSFCVGEKQVREFISIFRSANDKGDDGDDKTVYRG